MDDDIGHRESVVRIKIYDANVPADRRRSHNNILADILKPVDHVLVHRLDRVHGQCGEVDRKHYGLDDRRQPHKVVLNEPFKISRQLRHPECQRIKTGHVDRRSVDPPCPTLGFAQLSAIEIDPPVLLPYKMKDCDRGQNFPKHQLALGIKGDADRIPKNRYEKVEPKAAF